MSKPTSPQEWIDHVNQSIDKATGGQSQLTESELAIKGFSTPTQRRLWNNIMSKVGVYFEVGLYGGATFFSAIKGNEELKAIGVDDFSQNFGDPEIFNHFKSNLARYKSNNVVFQNKDFFSMTEEDLKELLGGEKVDVYYYDGEHSEESQAKALPKLIDHMSDTFLYIVDDVDWPQVWDGTQRGLAEVSNKATVLNRWHLTDHKPDGERFHNGVFIALMKKA
jgi:hypothetical protein